MRVRIALSLVEMGNPKYIYMSSLTRLIKPVMNSQVYIQIIKNGYQWNVIDMSRISLQE